MKNLLSCPHASPRGGPTYRAFALPRGGPTYHAFASVSACRRTRRPYLPGVCIATPNAFHAQRTLTGKPIVMTPCITTRRPYLPRGCVNNRMHRRASALPTTRMRRHAQRTLTGKPIVITLCIATRRPYLPRGCVSNPMHRRGGHGRSSSSNEFGNGKRPAIKSAAQRNGCSWTRGGNIASVKSAVDKIAAIKSTIA